MRKRRQFGHEHVDHQGAAVVRDSPSLNDLLWRIANLLVPTPRPSTVELLTLAEVVAYFVERHPGEPGIQSGAVLRGHHPRGYLVFQVFLDADHDICLDDFGNPHGRRLVARRLDEELSAMFSDTDVLLFN
jgi:hypothetical protein